MGSRRQVNKWVTDYNKRQTRTVLALPADHLPGRDACLKLLMTPPDLLNDDDIYLLGVLRQIPILQQLRDLVQNFAQMIRQRRAQPFDDWLKTCETSSIQACKLFAQSLMQDYDAVREALSSD